MQVKPYNRKVYAEDVISAYIELGNIWKVGERLGICGQTAHEILIKNNITLNGNRMTEWEMERIKQVYSSGLERGDGKLDSLARELNRTKQFVSRKARTLGMTTYHRKATPEARMAGGARAKARIAKNGHPRGMLGKTHTKEVREAVSKRTKLYWKNMSEEVRDQYSKRAAINGRKLSALGNRQKASWKAGWRLIGEKNDYYRSSWEANYGRYLQFLKEQEKIAKWEHEPEVFWFEGIKRGCLSYLPDFRVTLLDGSVEYHEVKGWMDARSRTKIKRMKKYFPKTILVVIEKPEYNKIKKEMSDKLVGWE